ncbi:hypothetical protein [Asticcacaulis solisilvae]|uniref:hypothetical protein n=1 Tax=Asticcacaulis solisilvae TaxID=1217274 RepID=UPI003FD6CDFB
MSEQSTIFVATPCFGGLVTQGYMQSVIALMQYTSARNIHMTLAMLGNDALITRSRNTLVSAFLNQSNATHLLFIDADIGFMPEHVVRMIEADKDVAGGMYPIKALDWDNALKSRVEGERPEDAALHYVGTPQDGDDVIRDGDFVTASYCGTGMMLIKRHVIETMIRAYPHLRYDAIHAYPRVKATDGTQYALFECLIDEETGLYLSEDYAFCHRWRALGGQIWLDTRGQLTHTGPHDFVGNPHSRFQNLAGRAPLRLVT